MSKNQKRLEKIKSKRAKLLESQKAIADELALLAVEEDEIFASEAVTVLKAHHISLDDFLEMIKNYQGKETTLDESYLA